MTAYTFDRICDYIYMSVIYNFIMSFGENIPLIYSPPPPPPHSPTLFHFIETQVWPAQTHPFYIHEGTLIIMLLIVIMTTFLS